MAWLTFQKSLVLGKETGLFPTLSDAVKIQSDTLK